MPTKITNATNGDCLTGSAETRIDVAPDGTLWLAVVDPNVLRWFRSTNGGATWTYSNGSDLALGQYNGAASIFIDADGYAHVAVQRYARDPQDVLYARGRPKSGGGWTWTTISVRPAVGRMGVDTDVKAFRLGTGWVAFCLWNTAAGTRVARIDISSSHTLTVASTNYGPSDGYDLSFGGLDFAAGVDGKTPATLPHLFLATAAMSGSRDIRLRRATYESGRWTWGSAVAAATGQNVARTAMTTVHDGTRFMVTWATSAGLFFREWDGVSTSAVSRNPPTLPSNTGEIYATSLAVDSQTQDVYLLAYGSTTPNVISCKLTRSAGTWGAWTTVATRTSNVTLDGKLQAVRHPRGGSVDFVYADVSSASSFAIQFAQIVGTVTEPETPTPITPSAPTLLEPGAGAQVDLTQGGIFTWRYSATQAGDRQQAWQFRKVTGGTTTYWNAAAQSFGASAVWNTGADQFAVFPPALWPVGTHAWSVRTRSSVGGADSAWASNRTLVSTEAPIVNVTGPSGLYYDDSTPLVEWTYASTLAQRSFEIRIVVLAPDVTPDSAAVWNSGVVASSTARRQRVPVTLNSGVGYRVYVRATNSQGVTSAWAYSDFVVSLDPPTGPEIGASDYVSYETAVPRARLDLVARSNFMESDQARVSAGWESLSTSTLTYVDADLYAGIEQGARMASVASGVAEVRTVLGTPPEAPPGTPQLDGPLNFPVSEGQAYTFLIYVRAVDVVRAVRPFIRWFRNDTGVPGIPDDTVQATVLDTVGKQDAALIGDTYGDQVISSLDTYVKVAITAVAPYGALMGRPYLQVLGATAAGERHWLSRASFHPGRSLEWQPGGYVDQQTIRVERSDDGGTTWVQVVDRLKTNYRQEVTFSDRAAPFGREVLYRAFTDVDTTLGGQLSSGASDLTAFRLTSQAWAIRDLARDDAEFVALVTAHNRSDAEAATVFRPSGRFYPIIDSEGLQSAEGSIELYVPRKEAESTSALLASGVPLLVQNPLGRNFLARFLQRDYAVEQIADRKITASYVEVG